MDYPAWIESAERRFHFVSIPFLLKGLILLNALTFFLEGFSPGFTRILFLDPAAILTGEWWRTLSFLLIPGFSDSLFSLLFLLIYVMFMWMISDGLEQELGEFKITLYFLINVVAINLVCLATGYPGTNHILFASLIIFFSILYPDVEILLFFIIPVKIKWIGIFIAIMTALPFLFGPWPFKLLTLASFAGFIAFLGPGSLAEWKRRRASAERRKRFQRETKSQDEED